MSVAQQFEIGGADSAAYRVTKHDGCTLVFGSLPIAEFASLTAAAGRDAVMSVHLARLTGSTHAWGPPAAVDSLVKTLTARIGGAKTGLNRWLAVGEHGSSSLAIVQHLTSSAVASAATAHPFDASDFSRCVQLLDTAPELRRDFPRMADVSPQWAGLVQNWAELEAMLAANDTRRLYARMREILEGTEQ